MDLDLNPVFPIADFIIMLLRFRQRDIQLVFSEIGAAEPTPTEDAGDGVFAVVELLVCLPDDGLPDFVGHGSQA